MIIPTVEEMKMYEKFEPLEKWRKRGYGTELRDDAPEDMKALALEVFSKDEMGFINGGGDVTATKTIINADGSTTTITTTIKDDGTVIVDRVTTKP